VLSDTAPSAAVDDLDAVCERLRREREMMRPTSIAQLGKHDGAVQSGQKVADKQRGWETVFEWAIHRSTHIAHHHMSLRERSDSS
jgi:hypothetical protein